MLASTHSFWKPLWLTRAAYRDIALACVFLNILGVSLPIFTRVVYDRVIPNFAEATLWVLFSGMILVLAFEVLFKLSRSYITDRLGNVAGAKLEQQFHQHLMHLPHGYSIAKTGQYFNYLQEIRDFFCQKLVPTLIDAPFVLTFLLAIYLICPAMALIPVVTGTVIIGLQYALHIALDKGLLSNQQALYAKQNVLVETMHGRETIRQLACYAPFTKAWESVTEAAAISQSNLLFWQGLVSHLCTAAIIFNSVLLIMLGVYEIHDTKLSVGGLLAINLLCARALSPLTSIGSILAKWPHLLTEMTTVESILSLPTENAADGEPFVLKGAIVLKDAMVQYSPHAQPVIKEASITLQQGQKMALVGASGAGKSTLLKVLSAEMPLTSGTIFWDERDSQNITPVTLRSQLSIVDQYPYFFARTLRDNLLMGIEREDAEIRHALEIVGMDQFVKAMGHGLELFISEGGLNLSGGQRQCFAIARALLRQSPVLIMDEPTSMMDHHMEARLVHNLNFAVNEKTVILATHRTPLLKLVDTIAVLENGKIVRQGKRDDVIRELSKNDAK